MDVITYDLVDSGGTHCRSIGLSPRVFASPKSQVAVHATVVWQLAKRRAGTHSALERSAMKGGGKKPYRQKGTGRARAGSSISPLWVGGAVVHGPRPRSYETGLNKKVRLAALASALTDVVDGKRLVVLDTLNCCTGRAKEGASLLRAVGANKGGVLIVLHPQESRVALSFRNLEGVTVIGCEGVNVYDLVRSRYIVMSEATLKHIEGVVEQRMGARTEEAGNE
jgi:large subunit ribosomal protein L4